MINEKYIRYQNSVLQVVIVEMICRYDNLKKKHHNVMEKVTKCHKIYLIECIKNKLRNSQVDFNNFKDYV